MTVLLWWAPIGCQENAENPLVQLARRGDLAALDRRLVEGVDPDTPNEAGTTPLIAAAFSGHVTVVQALLAAGADVDHVVRLPARELRRLGVQIEGDDGEDTWALFAAVNAGSEEIVKLLIDSGADLDPDTETDLSALLLAVRQNRPVIARALLDGGADFNATLGDGTSIILVALDAGNVDLARELVDLGVPVNAMTDDGVTALHAAVHLGAQDLVEALLDADADPSPKNSESLLLKAIESGRLAIARRLLRAGADPNLSNRRGVRPIFAAIRLGNRDLVADLIDQGVRLDVTNSRHLTPLRLALEIPDTELAMILHRAGAEDSPVKGAVPVRGYVRGLADQRGTPYRYLAIDGARIFGLAIDRDLLYWTDYDAGQLLQFDLATLSNQSLVAENLRGPKGITADGGTLIFIEDGDFPWSVSTINPDGGKPSVVWTDRFVHRPSAVTIDSSSRDIFWAETVSGRIRRGDLTGSSLEDILSTGLGARDTVGGPVRRVLGVSIDTEADRLVWSEATTGAIYAADASGRGAHRLFGREHGVGLPAGVAVDWQNDTIFWADLEQGSILRASGGSNEISVVAGPHDGVIAPFALAIDERRNSLVWSDIVRGGIFAVDTHGGSIRTVVPSVPGSLSKETDAFPFIAQAMAGVEACQLLIGAVKAVQRTPLEMSDVLDVCDSALSKIARTSDLPVLTSDRCEEESACGLWRRLLLRALRREPRLQWWLGEIRVAMVGEGRYRDSLDVLDRLVQQLDGLVPKIARDHSTGVARSGQELGHLSRTRSLGGVAKAVPDDGLSSQSTRGRFEDQGDGTILDHLTGLTWEKKCQCPDSLHAVGLKVSGLLEGSFDLNEWLANINQEGGNGFAGHADWRIPNAEELVSLVDYGRFNPAVARPFAREGCFRGCGEVRKASCSCTSLAAHWAADRLAAETENDGLVVNFALGLVTSKQLTTERSVRAVRGPALR